MFLEIVEALTIFDWVTPAKGFVEDVINDPTPFQTRSWTFFIPYGESLASGCNARQIEKMLDERGVKHWGSQITGGEYFFSVLKEQARIAEYVLQMAGVPISPISAGVPLPTTEMNNAVDFAPMGIIHTGPSLPARLFVALVRRVFA